MFALRGVVAPCLVLVVVTGLTPAAGLCVVDLPKRFPIPFSIRVRIPGEGVFCSAACLTSFTSSGLVVGGTIPVAAVDAIAVPVLAAMGTEGSTALVTGRPPAKGCSMTPVIAHPSLTKAKM
jgi:hypothetical protein